MRPRYYSQLTVFSSLVWGVSFALHERTVLDPRSGRIMNANLTDYHVPVNADVPSLEAILVQEYDPYVNALGIKGVGEIGITGTAGPSPMLCGTRQEFAFAAFRSPSSS